LGRIKAQLSSARFEELRRLKVKGSIQEGKIPDLELITALKDPHHRPKAAPRKETGTVLFSMKARQLVGQPASQGVATGKVRVIRDDRDLFSFKSGEILVVRRRRPEHDLRCTSGGGDRGAQG